jgi:broad specificity phosphatase PhoE
MPRITMVRHGQAAAGWGDDLDPGLSDVGRAQALATASALAAELSPQPIVCSPLRRCRETAAALADRWGVTPVVEPAVGEIVSPADQAGLEARGAWLRAAMQGRWSELGAVHHEWRQLVVDAVRALEVDTVVHSHFIAINVVVGAATGDDRVVCFAPDNCSWTVLDVSRDNIAVVELGRQATTDVR